MSGRAAQIDSLRSLLLQGQSLTTGLLSLGKGKGVTQRRETVSCGEGGARNDLPCRGRMGLLQRKSRAMSKDGCVAVRVATPHEVGTTLRCERARLGERSPWEGDPSLKIG